MILVGIDFSEDNDEAYLEQDRNELLEKKLEIENSKITVLV
jgi:hypothetical protein